MRDGFYLSGVWRLSTQSNTIQNNQICCEESTEHPTWHRWIWEYKVTLSPSRSVCLFRSLVRDNPSWSSCRGGGRAESDGPNLDVRQTSQAPLGSWTSLNTFIDVPNRLLKKSTTGGRSRVRHCWLGSTLTIFNNEILEKSTSCSLGKPLFFAKRKISLPLWSCQRLRGMLSVECWCPPGASSVHQEQGLLCEHILWENENLIHLYRMCVKWTMRTYESRTMNFHGYEIHTILIFLPRFR